ASVVDTSVKRADGPVNTHGKKVGMRVAGVDLAAEADRTGLAILNVGERESLNARMTIDELLLGADDDAIRDTIVQAGRTGIDVPLVPLWRSIVLWSKHAAAVRRAACPPMPRTCDARRLQCISHRLVFILRRFS